MAEGRGRWLLSGMLIFWTWSTLMMSVRVWAKVNVKRWGTDDYFITAAYLVSTLDVAASFWAAQHGYGLTLSSVADSVHGQIEKALFAQQQLYIAAMTLCKVSAALFLVRLSASKSHTASALAVAVLAVVWGALSMIAVGLRGRLDRPWATVDGSSDMHIRWTIVEMLGIVIETLIFGVAFMLASGVHISWRKRSVLLAAFAVRLILIPIAIVRICFLAPHLNHDPTLTNVVPHIITEAALHFAVISASITSLRPFLRTLHLDYTVGSKGSREHATQSTGPLAGHSRNRSLLQSCNSVESGGDLCDVIADHFDNYDCAALAREAVPVEELVRSGEMHREAAHRKAKGLIHRRATYPTAETKVCRQLRDIILSRGVPGVCHWIKRIKILVKFSEENKPGPSDNVNVLIQGPRGPVNLLIKSVVEKPGLFSARASMLDAYGSECFFINELDGISLNVAEPMGRKSSAGSWLLEGITILAECYETNLHVRLDKHAHMDMWYQYSPENSPGQTITAFDLEYRDWGIPACLEINRLAYEFTLANEDWAGTWDKLAFKIGNSTEIQLGEALTLGSTKRGTIDLKKAFGKDTVDIRHLNRIQMLDAYGTNGNGDKWKFGITFNATCTSGPYEMVMNKYQSVDKWVGHLENQPAWHGSVAYSDWRAP
ncbi:hypothetical protein V2A60_009422 [Cordyceps javanica]